MHDRALRHQFRRLAARIERGERVLKHHLDVPRLAAYFFARQFRPVAAVEHDRSRVRVDQPHDAARQRRFARAGFADDAERRASRQVERHVLDRRRHPRAAAQEAAGAIGLGHVRDRQNVLGRKHARRRRLQRRDGGDELLGVGMLRVVQDLRRRALFDHDAMLHHHDAVGDLGDDAEIMGDEQHRRLLALLQVADQLQDLRLRGDVERGGRLVGDQKLRVERQRHRDHGALPLAARQLMRIGLRRNLRIGNPHVRQQRQHPCVDLGLRQVGVDRKHLRDLVADGAQRIERRHRLLEDHRDAGAAHLAHLGDRCRAEVAALEHAACRRRSSLRSAAAA